MCMLDWLLSCTVIAAIVLWLAVAGADSLTRLAPDAGKPLFSRLGKAAATSCFAASKAAYWLGEQIWRTC